MNKEEVRNNGVNRQPPVSGNTGVYLRKEYFVSFEFSLDL
jgi:hypothetical protein